MHMGRGLQANLTSISSLFPSFAMFLAKIDRWTKPASPADSLHTSPAPKFPSHLRSPHLCGVHRLDEQLLDLAAFHRRDGRISGAAF